MDRTKLSTAAVALMAALGGCASAPADLHPPLRSPSWSAAKNDPAWTAPAPAVEAERRAVRSADVGTLHEPWITSCHEDPIEDVLKCSLASRGHSTWVGGYAMRGGPVMELVGIAETKYPHSDIIFRIDNNPAVRWNENDNLGRSAEVVRQMETGTTLQSRYTEWPNGVHVDDEQPLEGFAEELEELRTLLREYAAG